MKTEQFRNWLSEGDWTEKSKAHRISVLRSLERLQVKMDIGHGSLEEAFELDKFASLLSTLEEYKNDAKGGGEKYRALMPDSDKPMGRLSNAVSFLKQYGRFLSGEEPLKTSDEWPELMEFKRQFLERCPDFENFAQTSGTYWDLERGYKDRLINAVQSIIKSDVGDIETGRSILEVLSTPKIEKSGLPLNWRTYQTTSNSEFSEDYFKIFGILSRSTVPVLDAIENAAKSIRILKSKGLEDQTKGNILSATVCVVACARPKEACFAKSGVGNKIGNALLGRTLFSRGGDFKLSEVEEYLRLIERIYLIMEEDWDWKPLDLFDVQSFAWAALDDRWEDSEIVGASGLTKTAVRKAMAECNDLGEANFLSKYGFGERLRYRVCEKGESSKSGKSYPSKAIACVAFRFTDYGKVKKVNGGVWGKNDAGGMLEELGFEIIDTHENKEKDMTKIYPQNLILYGPPGTGKTWTSSEIAVQICDGSAPDDRDELMARYRELVNTGRVAFTTFHQSMGYEEFVEGLRPTTDTDAGEGTAGSGFRLEPRNGIFRDICARARQSKPKSSNAEKYDFSNRNFFKMSLGRAGSEEHIFEASYENQCVVLGYGGEIDWSDEKYKDYETVKEKWRTIEPTASGNNGNIAQVWCFRGSMKVGDIVVISDGNHKFRAIAEITGDYEFLPPAESDGDFISEDGLYCHRRSVKWLANLEESLPAKSIRDKNFTQISCYSLNKSKLNLDVLQDLIGPDVEIEEKDDLVSGGNFVLIIDEINRANISKVFGELITLLEPDKRIGSGPNALEVTLPYSGQKFGVPKNLYIIGTMNTADRSIALLDTALRRRFSFLEMMPLYNIEPLDREVEGVHLGVFLKAINARIEWMFDRDHQIGHSFLTGVESLRDLEAVVREKFIPLLTEYFYEDWEKVCIALNDKAHHFIVKEKLSAPDMSGAEEEDRFCYKVNSKPFPLDAYHAAYLS